LAIKFVFLVKKVISEVLVDEKEFKNNIPCIVDKGIIYNVKDMQKVLRDLGHVEYQQIIDNQVKSSGEGYIVSVVANNHSANIFVNRRIYLNVNGFEYMVIANDDHKSIVDLIDNTNIIRFIPLTNPLVEDIAPVDMVISGVSSYLDEEMDGEFAEINFDEDHDED